MSKADRKQAIKFEMERRAANSGVPKDLYVYEMRRHHADEAGPRTFVPTMRRSKKGKYDSSLWPSLFRSAIEDGAPIELAPDDSPMYRNGRTPLADICEWGHGENHLLILSERANSALGPFLQKTCRPVPVTCATSPLFGYMPLAFQDILNIDRSEGHWFHRSDGYVCTNISKYFLDTEKLGPSPLFKIPQYPQRILVLQPFVDAALEHSLTGFRYKRIWPHPPIPQVVNIEVKKLPRPEKEKQRDPKLSTNSQEIATDFLEHLLGVPLTADDDKPFQLVAYRLPDLSLPSGSIVAADLLLGSGKPFARKVAPGSYPLSLVAARIDLGADERIAFAILQFGDHPVACWEIATIGKPRKKGAKNSDDYCYGVDSGAGGLCDAKAQKALLDLADPEATQTKRMEEQMSKTYRHTRSWVHIQTIAGSAAVFSSGYGDGSYQSYFGLDEVGQPVALMTDFGVLWWPRKPIQ